MGSGTGARCVGRAVQIGNPIPAQIGRPAGRLARRAQPTAPERLSADVGMHSASPARYFIAGFFTVWARVRLDGSALWLMPGLASLAFFAWALTHTESDIAGRTYAAYGGIYIAASMIWMWLVVGNRPDRWDLTELAICLIGSAVILLPQNWVNVTAYRPRPVASRYIRSASRRRWTARPRAAQRPLGPTGCRCCRTGWSYGPRGSRRSGREPHATLY